MSCPYCKDSNVERLAGWGLWYVYWRIFSTVGGFLLGFSIPLLLWWMGGRP